MVQTVFYSWQSDRPNRETRGVVHDALTEALKLISADLQEAPRPDDNTVVLDHDTKGLSGSPDIAASILVKIEAASAFVADITPIAISSPTPGKRAKHVSNPNVLIELGYAKKALGPEKIIQIWNTAFTDCTVEDLPFDMRGRRGPVSYSLEDGASPEKLRAVRADLARELKRRIEPVLRQSKSSEAEPLPWKPHRSGYPAVWFEKGAKFVVNEPFHGSGRIWLKESPSRFVRMLPAVWSREEFKASHAVLLGHTSGFSWGNTSGGLLTYPGSIVRPEFAEGTQATMWFSDTGEVWAVDRWIVNEWQGRPTVYGDDLIKGWKAFIAEQLSLLIANGGRFPIHVRLGVSGVLGSFWPVRNPAFGAPEALEDHAEHQFEIISPDFANWSAGLIEAWARYREIYSIPPPDAQDIRTVLGIVSG